MQNYINNIKIIKDGVVTTLNNPTTNGRFKIVNGKIVMKETIPFTKVSDGMYTAEIDGEYMLYGVISLSDTSNYATPRSTINYATFINASNYATLRSASHLTISINDNKIYDHYLMDRSYTIMLPVNGTGTLTINYGSTIKSIDQLKLWTFL